MNSLALILVVHLAGTAPRLADIPAGLTCQQAGERWLASVRYRSPNDFYECVRIHVPAR